MPECPEFLVESDRLQMLNAETLKKWRRRVVTVERDYLVRRARECDAFSGMDSTILVEASPCSQYGMTGSRFQCSKNKDLDKMNVVVD